jgi:hypothetical protein
MDNRAVPTLGRVIQILRDLGFLTRAARPGVLALTHDASGAEFLFRERGADTPARANELVNLKVQLTTRGLLSERELDNLLAPIAQETPISPP